MTAEIAILNKTAIALAADSAVTVEGENGVKIYHTENKLFTLSKYRPVGIMIYNNTELAGLPWETIIKEYRRQFSDNKFALLSEYADDFIRYINANRRLFPEEQQERVAKRIFSRFFRTISRSANKMFIDQMGKKKSRTAILSELLSKNHSDMLKEPFFEGFDDAFEGQFKDKFRIAIRARARAIFNRQRFSASDMSKICDIAAFVFSRSRGIASHTGLVIAGFGEDEMFPRLRCFNIEAIIMDRLKYYEEDPEEISLVNPSAVRAFAVKSTAETIIKGVNPRFHNEFMMGAFKMVYLNTDNMIDKINELSDAQKQQYKTDFAQQAVDAWKKYFRDMDKYAKEQFEDPVVKSISVLPKEDLAIVAESLVSVTSFRQRISNDDETVGGPIDVAIISKGDGFIWIKRKHYFDRRFNASFMDKYFKDD